jgi:hypothetical protein
MFLQHRARGLQGLGNVAAAACCVSTFMGKGLKPGFEKEGAKTALAKTPLEA